MSPLNPFIARLGIEFPIIQAPMAGVSTPQLAAAVSNAGGLGSLGIGASTADQARKMIEETRSLTREPINVNVFCHVPAQRAKRRGCSTWHRCSPRLVLSLRPRLMRFTRHFSMTTRSAIC